MIGQEARAQECVLVIGRVEEEKEVKEDSQVTGMKVFLFLI